MKSLSSALSDQAVVPLGSHPVETTGQDFNSLNLSSPLQETVKKIGFQHPTPIQLAVIPEALRGKDIIGLAQTGSGKTAAFVLPLADKLMHGEGLRGLILCPTREIALQTKAFLDLFGKHHRLKTACVIGGVAMGPQIRELSKKPDIVVATPGRLFDHMQRGYVRLDRISELVLDEADHMLDLGFLPQITEILRHVPQRRQTMMFSATMPEGIERLTKQFLKEPVRIDVSPKGRAAEGITHRLYLVEKENKKNCLLGLLHQELGSTLVFTRTKLDADWIHRVLEKEGHPVDKIHSNRSQQERVQALQGFREGQHRILVATDIAARGIDVFGIQHIVNFDLPDTVEEYIHRAGRTARLNALGLVSSIGTWMDRSLVKEIEKTIGQEIPRCIVPGVPPFKEIVVAKPFGRRGRRR